MGKQYLSSKFGKTRVMTDDDPLLVNIAAEDIKNIIGNHEK
jgi:hypothetical protein